MSNQITPTFPEAIAPGGAIVDMAIGPDGRLFLASPAGLLRQQEDDWQMLMRGIPFWRLNTIASAGNSLFLAGMPHGMMRSFDDGESWHRSFLDQTDAPITKIVPSPNYGRDRVLLATTAGDGILRSTDGGRHWQLSNFGLRDFELYDIVTAPAWNERYEVIFALGETAVYQSPNGGRAWRRCDCADEIRPLALAVSPNFAADQTAILGTEAGHLYLSNDGGRQWTLWANGFESVGSLCFFEEQLVVVESERILALSLTDPSQRSVLLESPLPILGLSHLNETLYATLVDGVLMSKDGRIWQPITPYVARRFVWFVQNDHVMVASGPEEGVWRSTDGGHTWALCWLDGVVLDLELTDDRLLLSSDAGIFASADWGTSWQQLIAPELPFLGVVQLDDALWLADGAAHIHHLQANGTAIKTKTPFSGAQLLEMRRIADGVITAVYQPSSGEVELWHWSGSAEKWHPIFSERAQPTKPALAFDTALGLLIGLEEYLYFKGKGSWQKVKVTTRDGGVTAVLPTSNHILVGATDKLFALDRETLELQSQPMWKGDPILTMVEVEEGVLIVGVNGRFSLVK